MSKADDVFYREFGVILGLLIIFAFVAYFLGKGIAADAHAKVMASEGATLARIQPVGQVRIAEDAPSAASAAAPAASAPTSAAEPVAPKTVASAAGAVKQAAMAAAPAAGGSARVAAADGKTGEQIYQGLCMACHVVGAANAPKTGDTAAWEPRAALGIDALVGSVLKGKGAMPPNAGNPSLSEAEIRLGVEYLLEQAGLPAG